MAVAARQPAFPERRHGRLPIEYRRILVPLVPGAGSPALTTACRLAAERGAAVRAVTVIEVPSELPLDAHMLEEESDAKDVLDEAQAIADLHDVDAELRVVRARGAGPAIIEEAAQIHAELIVLTAALIRPRTRRSSAFGKTTSYVLEHATCRVLLSVRKP